MLGHWRQVQKHRESGGALNQRTDRGAVQADDHVAFPMARHGTIFNFGWSLADHHFRGDELLSPLSGPGSWHAQRSAGAQTGRQFAS